MLVLHILAMPKKRFGGNRRMAQAVDEKQDKGVKYKRGERGNS